MKTVIKALFVILAFFLFAFALLPKAQAQAQVADKLIAESSSTSYWNVPGEEKITAESFSLMLRIYDKNAEITDYRRIAIERKDCSKNFVPFIMFYPDFTFDSKDVARKGDHTVVGRIVSIMCGVSDRFKKNV